MCPDGCGMSETGSRFSFVFVLFSVSLCSGRRDVKGGAMIHGEGRTAGGAIDATRQYL